MRILLIQASLSVCGAIRCNASGIVWRRKRKSWVFLRAAHVPQAAVRWWNRGIDSENRGSFSRSICGLSPSKKWRAPMRFRIYIVSATVAVSLALSGCGGHGVEVATTSGGIGLRSPAFDGESPNRAQTTLAMVRARIAEVEFHLQEPGQVSMVYADDLRKRLSQLKERMEDIEKWMKAEG